MNPEPAAPAPSSGFLESLLNFLRFDLWGESAVHWLGLATQALLLLLLGLWLAKRFATLARKLIERRGGDAVLASFVRNTVYVLLAVVVLIGALDRAGVPTASMLAALGAAGLAIGLALKDSLSNLASGVLLIVTRPFRAGDYVEIGGNAGTVERIDLLQTVLVTADNKVIAVPNGQVMGGAIINFTARPQRRVDLLVLIGYDSDLNRAIAVVQEVLGQRADLVQHEPAPQIVVTRLADHGVELSVRVWVATADVIRAQSELLTAIKLALEAAEIRIPYPQRVMRVVHPKTPDAFDAVAKPVADPRPGEQARG